MAEHEHKAMGVKLVIAEISQGMLEKFLDASKRRLDEMGVNSIAQLPEVRSDGIVLRAAIEAGLIVEPAWKVEDVEGMSPKVTRWAARKIDKEYGEATRLPPE